jgi:hypothetical protein
MSRPRREHGIINFGDWVVVDPASERLDEAEWNGRYGTPSREDILLLCSTAACYRSVVTNELGVKYGIEKLRAIAKAVREVSASPSKQEPER